MNMYGVRLRDNSDDRVTELISLSRHDALASAWTHKYVIVERFGDHWMPVDSLERGVPDPWLPAEARKRLILPSRPGTVIAIGEWWLVRLRPFENNRSAWELLPAPSRQEQDRIERTGAKTQCIYSDEWVLAEAEQEGSFDIIAAPRDPQIAEQDGSESA